MRKLKPNKQTLLQFIYDYGMKQTCQILNITEQEVTNILYPINKTSPKISSQKSKPLIVKEELSNIISRNYNKLFKKYVKNKDILSMCQNSEDVFHNTLITAMEEISQIDETFIMDYIEFKLKQIDLRIKQDQKELYKHQIYLETYANTLEANKEEE